MLYIFLSFIYFIYTFTYPKGPPVQFPKRAGPPTSFGAPPGAPSAPGAPSYPPMGFSNAPPTSFGMPQPYIPYPTQNQPIPVPGGAANVYPPQPMPTPSNYPSSMHPNYSAPTPQPMPTPSYPSSMYSNHRAPSLYPQQQTDMYPDLYKAPDAKECFSSMAPSSYPSYATSSVPYQGGSYPGGQGVGSYSYSANPPTAVPRGATPAPRRNRFTPKVRSRMVFKT